MDNYIKKPAPKAYLATSEALLTTARAVEIMCHIAAAASGGDMETKNHALRQIRDILTQLKLDKKDIEK